MTHPYGNYVVQRLFECSNEQLRRTIYEATQGANAEEIKKTSYGEYLWLLLSNEIRKTCHGLNWKINGRKAEKLEHFTELLTSVYSK